MAHGSYEGAVPGQSGRRSGRGGREGSGRRWETPSGALDRACILKEGCEGIKVRFHRNNMLGDGKIVLLFVDGAYRSSDLNEPPSKIFLGILPSPHGRTRMIVFPLIRSVRLKAAPASSRAASLPMLLRSRPFLTRWTTSLNWA